ncbi:unnamed protein product [Zymoseptoria tritici ST99CH_1A5]|uniref:2EXR domain-containing protein n=2 Tax=Zymoseptoria tritici TaxID=1047171 RepID=A0A2H1G4N6_ZYMTR|nr:unnamed protein product [Zymoseptoria tritici ST99CH_1E4]SMY22398.1 unnamed protein product [Zymoseptoria tritici ST99CH_1A5]
MADSTKTTRSSKRKRTQVSYSADDYFDSLDMEGNGTATKTDIAPDAATFDTTSDNNDDDDEPEDGEFTRKGKGKAPPKKKVKIAPQSKKRKPKEQKPFRFLELPAELRDEIYDLCLTEPDGLLLVSKRRGARKTVARGSVTTQTGTHYHGKYRSGGYRGWRRYYYGNQDRPETTSFGSRSRRFVPALLAVNKQMREEGSSRLYKQEIALEDTTALFNFIATIGDYNRQMVSSLTIKGWGQGRGKADAHNTAAFAMLSVCKNIQTLHMDCSLQAHRDPADLADTFYRAAHFFLEALVDAKGDVDAAVDVIQLAEWHFDKTRVTPPTLQSAASGSAVEYKPVTEVEEQFQDELKKLLVARCRLD